MTGPRTVRSFVSSSPEYHRAFQAFLAHTDQKDKAREWLRHEVDGLANRSVMIDAGAGSGKLTSWLTPLFGTVIAIEPNPSHGVGASDRLPRRGGDRRHDRVGLTASGRGLRALLARVLSHPSVGVGVDLAALDGLASPRGRSGRRAAEPPHGLHAHGQPFPRGPTRSERALPDGERGGW